MLRFKFVEVGLIKSVDDTLFMEKYQI